MKENSINSLFSFFPNYSERKIRDAVFRLRYDQRMLIFTAFGEDLNQGYQKNHLLETQIRMIDSILQDILPKLLKNPDLEVRNNLRLVDYFPEYSFEEIIFVIEQLSYDKQELFKKAFDDDYRDYCCSYLLSKNEKSRLYYLIHHDLLKKLEERQISNNDSNKVEDRERIKRRMRRNLFQSKSNHKSSISHYQHTSISREDEIDLIKKAKLSFYYAVGEEEGEQYLNYYLEAFPSEKKKYQEIIFRIKELKNFISLEDNLKFQNELAQLEEKRKELLEQYIEDSKIYRELFLENNYRFVLSLVSKVNRGSVSLDDVVSEGIIGLMRALQKYDVEFGNRFSTYAVWSITNYARRYVLNNRSDIRISRHLGEKINRIMKVSNELYYTLQRNPTISELVDATGYPEKEIKRLLEYYQLSNVSGLDDLVGEDADMKVSDMIGEEDSGFEKIEDDIFSEQFQKLMDLAKLSRAEKFILRKKFGLDDGITYTLKEVAEQIGSSYASVYNMESKALDKIKKAAIKVGFFDYNQINEDIQIESNFKQLKKSF